MQDKVDQPKETCAGQEDYSINKKNQNTSWKEKARGWAIVKCGLRTHPTFFARRVSVVHFLKTTKQWSRWLPKDEVQQWDTCPEPTELRLFDCSTESTRTEKSKSKHVDTKNQREFSRDEWNHFLRLFLNNEFLDVLSQPFQQFSLWFDRFFFGSWK